MTTKQEKYDRSYIGPAIRLREEYFLGLDEVEVLDLKNLLETSLLTGMLTTGEENFTRHMLRKLNENLKPSERSSEDSNHQQPYSELRQELQECRKRLNEVEDKLDDLLAVGEMLI